MASSKDKFQLVFEAQDAASSKIRGLKKQLADLGGPAMVKSKREISKLTREIDLLSGQAKKSGGIFTRFTKGIAIGNIAANVASSAWRGLTAAIKSVGKATLVAANVEELKNVVQFLGHQAGYSTEQLNGFYRQLREGGIAQKEANQAMLRAIQGNIDLADAVKLGRIAQDAAVIGQMNSSAAYEQLIDAVVKGRVVMLKSLGIQGTFQRQYAKLAKTLGKAQTELTDNEKLQARLNLVYEGGAVIAGAYGTAMGNASKQLRSMERYIQDLQVSIGQYLVPSLTVVVHELSSVTKGMTSAFGDETSSKAAETAKTIGEVTAGVILVGKVVSNVGQIVFDALQMSFIAPIEAVITSFSALYTALSDPFNMDSWERAGIIMDDVADGFVTDWTSIKTDMDDIVRGVETYNEELVKVSEGAPMAQNAVGKTRAAHIAEDSLAAMRNVALASDGMANEIEETVTIATKGIVEVSRSAIRFTANAGSQVKAIMGNAVDGMISSMVTGRQSFGEIFSGMAQDFMQFFIKQTLFMLINAFIPGLGSILGGIFDTPANDRMAAQQGRDFMAWFTRGALAEAQGGSELAVGIARTNRIAPVAAPTNGGSSMVVMNVNVSGNVLTDAYVEKTIAPRLRRLVNDGRSLLELKKENKTGGRDVNVT